MLGFYLHENYLFLLNWAEEFSLKRVQTYWIRIRYAHLIAFFSAKAILLDIWTASLYARLHSTTWIGP